MDIVSITRKREDYTAEQLGVLQAAYDAGMKTAGVKCKEAISKVATELQISEEKVKQWIGNRNKKSKTSTSQPKKKSSSEGPNGYSFFCSQQKRGKLDNATFLRNCGEKWRALSDAEKVKFKENCTFVLICDGLNEFVVT